MPLRPGLHHPPGDWSSNNTLSNIKTLGASRQRHCENDNRPRVLAITSATATLVPLRRSLYRLPAFSLFSRNSLSALAAARKKIIEQQPYRSFSPSSERRSNSPDRSRAPYACISPATTPFLRSSRPENYRRANQALTTRSPRCNFYIQHRVRAVITTTFSKIIEHALL